MLIRAKVGTHSSVVLRVKYKRKFPRRHEKIWVKELEPGSQWFQVRVDRYEGEFDFYYLDRI